MYHDENTPRACPFVIQKITPIQMPNLDLDEVKENRSHFTTDEWIDVLLRSIGMELARFTKRVKWLLLARMMPLVENNLE